MARLSSILALAVCFTLALPAWPGRADLWSGFYVPTTPAKPAPSRADNSCISAILDAQARYQIPDNLLLAIGIQEAGRQVDGKVTVWPWAVNADGTGMFFRTREQAIGWVKTQLAQGVRSIDVGCMQINLRWHGDAFASLEEAFDPVENARYGARFLTDLKREEGTWWDAAGSYHSRTDEFRDRYLASLVRNHKVANAEYPRFASLPSSGRSVTARVRAERLPTPPVLWGDATEQDRGFSIYSRQPLVPMLPAFQEVALTDER